MSAYKTGIVIHHGNHGRLDVVVLGDSHGLMWAPVIDEIAADMDLSVDYMTADGTPVFFDPRSPEARGEARYMTNAELTAFNNARLDLIRQQKPKLVIIAASWLQDSMKDGARLLQELTKSGAHVLLIEDPPLFKIGDRNAPQFMSYLGIKAQEDGRAWSSRIDVARADLASVAVRDLAATCPGQCTVVETRDLFQSSGAKPRLLVLDANQPLFIDDDHLSVAGALLAKSRIAKQIQRALGH